MISNPLGPLKLFLLTFRAPFINMIREALLSGAPCFTLCFVLVEAQTSPLML
jgi:hypothetical protein